MECIRCGQTYGVSTSDAKDFQLFCTLACETEDLAIMEEGFKILESATLNQIPPPTINQLTALEHLKRSMETLEKIKPEPSPSLQTFTPIKSDTEFEE